MCQLVSLPIFQICIHFSPSSAVLCAGDTNLCVCFPGAPLPALTSGWDGPVGVPAGREGSPVIFLTPFLLWHQIPGSAFVQA